MAVIREILRVEDQFSAALNKFNNLGNKVAGTAAKIAVAVGGVAAVKSFINLSDSLTQTQARLESIKGEFAEVKDLQDAIFAAAQRSRGDYMDMASSVAALKAQTGDVFKSTAEAVRFTELLNKQFTLSGTSASGVQSTMYNLTQALATGVLRGNDLQMVLSNSPAIIQKISDYMGVSIGDIRKMAQEGQITADIVKNAIMSAGDDIDAQFEKMPMTFGQAMQKLKNEGIRALQPLSETFNNFVNSDTFQAGINACTWAIRALGQIGSIVFGYLFSAIEWVGQKIGEFKDRLAEAGITMQTVITSIGAAIGVVAGAILGTMSVIANTLAIVANAFITGAEWAYNAWNKGVYLISMALYNFARGAAEKFNSVISAADGAATAIANAFIRGANMAIGGINGLINALNQIPGVNIGNVAEVGEVSSIISDRIDLSAIKAPTYNGRKSFDKFKLDTVSTGEAWDSGYQEGSALGDIVAKGLSDFVDSVNGLGESIGDLGDFGDVEVPDYSGAGGGSGKKANVGTVDKVKDVKLSDEDMKIYRDLAERRYMANVELQTLAPNISVSIPESAAKNLTSEDVANKLKAILIEQAAAHTAVAHAH